jgi:hypothetical protein
MSPPRMCNLQTQIRCIFRHVGDNSTYISSWVWNGLRHVGDVVTCLPCDIIVAKGSARHHGPQTARFPCKEAKIYDTLATSPFTNLHSTTTGRRRSDLRSAAISSYLDGDTWFDFFDQEEQNAASQYQAGQTAKLSPVLGHRTTV